MDTRPAASPQAPAQVYFPRESSDSRVITLVAHPISHTKEGAPQLPAQPLFKSRLDRIMHPQKRYLGMKRPVFMAFVAAILLVIIGLALGLGIGLSRRTSLDDGPLPPIPLPELGGMHAANVSFYETKYPDACGNGVDYYMDGTLRQVVALSGAVWDALAARNETMCGKSIRVRQKVIYEKTNDPNMPVSMTGGYSYPVVERCEDCGPRDLGFPERQSTMYTLQTGEARHEIDWYWEEQKN